MKKNHRKRDDSMIGTITDEIAERYDIPPEAVRFMRPDGWPMRPIQSLRALRSNWSIELGEYAIPHRREWWLRWRRQRNA